MGASAVAETGSHPTGQAAARLDASRFDPARGSCPRCSTMEDLLETARIQVEHARREAEKADDEAVEMKAENLRLRANGSRQDYALVKEFQRRAERAEAALAALRDRDGAREGRDGLSGSGV